MTARAWWLQVLAGVGLLAVLSLLLRPLFPVDETRYAAVAWEMWKTGNFLVPHLNGSFYDHKPPVLFWLIHAGWAVTGGVNDWWPRLIGPLSTILSLWLLMRLGARLWPERPSIGRVAALMLLGTWFIAFYQTALMFDMPLLATVIWTWSALYDATKSGKRGHWAIFGAALGLGLLVKGPVVWVYTLPLVATMRWWAPVGSARAGVRPLILAALVMLVLPGIWLAAAWLQGSGEYFSKLLVDQTVHRVSGEMGHPRPWYWYLPALVLLPLPWTLWWPAWRGLGKFFFTLEDHGSRFVTVAMVGAFLILSLVSGKQVHYLVPVLTMGMLALSRGLHVPRTGAGWAASLVPALAMSPLFLLLAVVASRAGPFDARPWLAGVPAWALATWMLLPLALMVLHRSDAVLAARRLAVVSILFCATLMATLFPMVSPYYDLAPTANVVAKAQAAGRPVLYVGNYQGEFGFLGRLSEPVIELAPNPANRWVVEHPHGLVVVRRKRLALQGDPVPEATQPYKSDEILMFRASDLSASGTRFRDPVRNEY